MAKLKSQATDEPTPKLRPALSPEARENQLISLATDLVEKRLRDGSASSQETTHFLKLATQRSRLENQLLQAQTEMAIAKKEALQAQKRMDEMYSEAIAAMRTYNGQGEPDEYDD